MHPAMSDHYLPNAIYRCHLALKMCHSKLQSTVLNTACAGLQGWQGLQEEMALDMRRLWHRNLGRDDRIVSDHGRESRHPFLDESLLQLLLSLPLPLIADLRLVCTSHFLM